MNKDDLKCKHYRTTDICLHRYQCIECGEVFFYSSRAEDHFMNGALYYIEGLNSHNKEVYRGSI